MTTNKKTDPAEPKSPKDSKISKIKSSAKEVIVDFPIVGIGASAGGLEALELFFTNMPVDSGIAFVVIQHLDPTHVGIMPELLQRITKMKVSQVTDGLNLKPNGVYVIPPNKSMSILNRVLHLFDPVESRGLRLPIDIFFRALADDQHEKSVGIILSGMGSDGSLGVKSIKEQNGLVLVQSPESAKFDGMPRSAIAAVMANIIAPADQLPIKLMDCLRLYPSGKTESELEDKAKSSLDKIIILLRQQTGHDFSLYKKNTLIRRIERRKSIHQLDRIQDYVRFLQENPKEIELLFKELLIGVTNFFRDPNVWNELLNKTLPELLDQLPQGYVLRAWVTGCSTGEEAYSLAIIFREAYEKLRKPKNLSLQIFATDLDQEAIERARKGVYSKNIVVDVNEERITRFFTAVGDSFQITSSIREMVVFAPQNVIKDAPFTKLDILSCRNMLIYMEAELQNKLIDLFHYSLNSEGLLILGTSETIGIDKTGFLAVEPRLKIYKRDPAPVSVGKIELPTSYFAPKTPGTEKKSFKTAENIQTLTDQIVIQRYSPASMLVNQQGDIIYITGRTGKYIDPVAGKANLNIFAMLRDEFRQAIPGAFRKALQNFDPVILHGIKVGTGGDTQYVNITVQRIDSPQSLKGMIMIVFTDVAAPFAPDSENIKKGKTYYSAKTKMAEDELHGKEEEIQAMREEMQTSQEELKSTNEELQSTNEELQSTNEELTTSKEEMQSLNEELKTGNIDLQSKINDYLRASDDMKNLLNSTEIATLFLDRNLNIRRFTDQITDIFKLRQSDIGRPFTDQVNDLNYPEIGIHASQVLRSLTSIETAISTRDGRWYSVRIMPYRTLDDRIDGLVITFNDITIAKKLELELKKANEALRKTS